MSQTVIFSVGAFIFGLTIWGSIMAAGIWLGQSAESEDERSESRPVVTDRGIDDVADTTRRPPSD